MERDTQSAENQQQKKRKRSDCEECKENPSKYTCPGCSFQSCSLPCVKAHKLRTGCSGKRDPTQFVPLSQFNENVLLSDYNLLEEMKRVSESARRIRSKLHAYGRVPPHFLQLRKAASRRKISLLFLPNGMTRREKNLSRYDPRKNSISWTIEWRFHSTDVVLLDHRVAENDCICSVIQKHLTPGPWKHKLKQFCKEPLESLKFFIREYPKGRKSSFRELDANFPIGKQLAKIVVLEYPVIHVFLPPQKPDFEVVVRNIHPATRKSETKDSSSNLQPHQDGVLFKEEEIEEDHSSGDYKVCLETLNDTPNGPRLPSPGIVAGNDVHSGSMSLATIFNDMEFDIDQSLLDSYSDLIAQLDPDDFLDVDGDFINELDTAENDDFSNLISHYLVDEEMEEGEIVEYK